jgi:hypothetical protein
MIVATPKHSVTALAIAPPASWADYCLSGPEGVLERVVHALMESSPSLGHAGRCELEVKHRQRNRRAVQGDDGGVRERLCVERVDVVLVSSLHLCELLAT